MFYYSAILLYLVMVDKAVLIDGYNIIIVVKKAGKIIRIRFLLKILTLVVSLFILRVNFIFL